MKMIQTLVISIPKNDHTILKEYIYMLIYRFMDTDNIVLRDQLSILFEHKLEQLRQRFIPFNSNRDPEFIVKSASNLSYKIDNFKKRSRKKEEYV